MDLTGRVLEEIRRERDRQVTERAGAVGEENDAGEFSAAAACYALDASCLEHPLKGSSMPYEVVRRHGWPWGGADWKPEGTRRNLLIAAALIVAEIERIDARAERSRRCA